jgi:hypothetical protein
MTKDQYLFRHFFNIYFVIEFQNHGNEHDHGLLWVKNVPMYGMQTNEKIEHFVDMYIFCDVSLQNPLQSAQHQHTPSCIKKPM